jgi:DNA-binding transcriptional LysR family regulator
LRSSAPAIVAKIADNLTMPIDDILAVLDCGSLAQAAEKRGLTQSAFTRRARTIEGLIGATLFDRRRKPVTLMPGVQTLEPELRELSARLHKLGHMLKTTSSREGKPLTFVCQHALTTTISPRIVRAVTRNGELSVRVHSGNQDDCLMQLLSKEVDLAIMYALPQEPESELSRAFESVDLGEDWLIPVCAPSQRDKAYCAAIPIIAYPANVFLGRVFTRMISYRMPVGAARAVSSKAIERSAVFMVPRIKGRVTPPAIPTCRHRLGCTRQANA